MRRRRSIAIGNGNVVNARNAILIGLIDEKCVLCCKTGNNRKKKKRRCGILRIKYIIWFGHIASPLLTVLTQGIFTLRSHCRCGPCAECVTFFPSNIFEAQTKFGLFGHFNIGGFCFFCHFCIAFGHSEHSTD